jgi:hypothetical protein
MWSLPTNRSRSAWLLFVTTAAIVLAGASAALTDLKIATYAGDGNAA